LYNKGYHQFEALSSWHQKFGKKLTLIMKNWPYDPQSSYVASSKFKLIGEYVNIESITFEDNEELIIKFGFF